MNEPAWVEEFLSHLRRTARNGRLNVQLSCELANVYRMQVYRFRQSEAGERLRSEWAAAESRASAVHSNHERLLHSR